MKSIEVNVSIKILFPVTKCLLVGSKLNFIRTYINLISLILLSWLSILPDGMSMINVARCNLIFEN